MKRIVLHNTDDEDARNRTATPAATESRTTAPAPSGRQQPLPSELIDIVIPSLKVGAVAGACGLFAGAAAGIVRSAPTVFFSLITGGQWFTLATSYYGARQVVLNRFGGEGVAAPTDKVKASTVAGGVAGTFGGFLRGPRNVLPGALMFSLFGAGGQAVANWRAARAANAPPTSSKGFWARWSPFTRLSDRDYEKILEERLLRVEVDIAMIDDHIKELRESEKQMKKESVGSERSDPASPNRD
ncbi:hypothetical protein MMYC01_207780 [Madurella mycetomatis]|uniref:Uncharacterized protein n=1 Tax=Madurella mycetomatis TaxID=100816 RepID=A0A175VXR9_9PEZI|nr:hypothetical protein MMYC01_207780 [Madurella mycetomatis]